MCRKTARVKLDIQSRNDSWPIAVPGLGRTSDAQCNHHRQMGIVSRNAPPSLFGVTPLVVRSGFMSGDHAGHIEVGDLTLVWQSAPAEPEVGDIITDLDKNTTVPHRIIAIDDTDTGRQFITQSDTNDAADTDAVTAAQLVGVYRGRIPKLSDFVLFLQEPVGMLLFIGVPVLAFIGYDLLHCQRYARQQ